MGKTSPPVTQMAKSTPSSTSKNLVPRFLQFVLLEIAVYMTLRKLILKLYKIDISLDLGLMRVKCDVIAILSNQMTV